MSLADALEAAAGALSAEAERIRPANGDPRRLLASLDAAARAHVLGWLLANRPDDGEELAAAWSDDPAGQSALLALDPDALPKTGRKLLRRLRHALRSRGVATPEPGPAPTVARLPGLEDELGGAYVTQLDPLGARQVFWLDAHPSGGARLFEAVLDDAAGLVGFELYSATRSEVRRFVKQVTEHAPAPALAVEPATAKALVLAAAARQGARPLPKRWVEWRGRLAGEVAAPLPGALVRAALGPVAGPDALAEAAKLVADGKLGPWPPTREAVAPVVERIRTALDSPLVVSPAAKREQVARLVVEASAELFAGAAGEVATRRFEESAFVLWRRGDEAGARACLVAADAFAAGSPGENPVARAFVERWLAPLLGGAEPAPAAPETPLLVRP